MSTKFAEHIIDSMVDENGHCGERGLSPKQFWAIAQHLSRGEAELAGCWSGHYKTVDFTSTNYEGNIGRYFVVLNEYFHFNPRYTVVSIDLRPQEEVEAEEAEAKRLAELRDFSHSEWQFQPKKRVDLDLTLVNDYEYEGMGYSYYDDGTRHLYTFRDGDGNCYIWRTANSVSVETVDEHDTVHFTYAEVGSRVTMRATVKEHSEYKGTKQTVITRPTIKAIA